MDLKLVDYDLQIIDGDVSFVKGRDAIAQDITMELRTFLGTCIYDRSVGVPYLTVIFQRGVSPATIEQILRQFILQVPGVLTISELTVNSLSYQTRELELSGTCTTIDGEIDFSGDFSPL